MTPRLSIIIPTRNRSQLCLATARSVLAFDVDFEIVIYDSSTEDGLEAQLAGLNDARVRYIRACGQLNMTQCFEFAVAEARGEFVCMIGDDDGVTPALFACVDLGVSENLDSVTTTASAFVLYNWPDIRSRYFGDEASGRLMLRVTGRAADVRIVPATSLLAEFLKRAGQGCGDLPRVYHGLVRRALLGRMRSTFGRCFDGVSPDVSFSYLAARLSDRHAIVQTPLTISGTSASSNAGRSAMHQHKGDLWSDAHMKNYRDEVWPSTVPEFFSVETVWGQATLAALLTAGEDIGAFNLPHLYGLLLVRHYDRWRETLRVLARQSMAIKWATCAATAMVALSEAASIFRKLARRSVRDRRIETFRAASIVEASALVNVRMAEILP